MSVRPVRPYMDEQQEARLAKEGYELACSVALRYRALKELSLGKRCLDGKLNRTTRKLMSADARLLRRLERLSGDLYKRFPSRMFVAAFLLKPLPGLAREEEPEPEESDGLVPVRLHEARELLLGMGPTWVDHYTIFKARPQLPGDIDRLMVPSTMGKGFRIMDVIVRGRSLFTGESPSTKPNSDGMDARDFSELAPWPKSSLSFGRDPSWTVVQPNDEIELHVRRAQ